jgi:hypothetical protein
MDFPERRVNAAWNRRTLLKSAMANVGGRGFNQERNRGQRGSRRKSLFTRPARSRNEPSISTARKFCLKCGRRNEYSFGKI